MESKTKYVAFKRDGFDGNPIEENERAIKEVIKVTGWKSYKVEVLPDRIVELPYSFISPNTLVGQIKVTNKEVEK